jgi:sulfur carrier protein
MRIELNGATELTKATTLAELIAERGFAPDTVATAVEGAFVQRSARAETSLRDGLRVEVLSPMQGG